MDPEPADERSPEHERLELLDALTAAADRRDEVFRLVSQAQDPETAVRAVQDLLGVAEVPAAAVIDLQLRRLTVEERAKVRAMRDELRSVVEAHRRE